jgi:hypothetical protein
MAASLSLEMIESNQVGAEPRVTQFNYQNFAYLCSEIFSIEVQIIKYIRNVRHE